MAENESHTGPIMPYGVAIREATASGDAARIRQMAEHARAWLTSNAGHESVAEVEAALRELESSRGS